MNEPFLPVETVDQVITELRIPDPGQATIREIVALVNGVEARTGVKYVRMEMGVPGLAPEPQSCCHLACAPPPSWRGPDQYWPPGSGSAACA